MKKLSDTEFSIMKILWKHQEPMTSNEILEEVKDVIDWKLASLMTTLARMADKGYVHCDRTTRTNYYMATVSEEQYKSDESESLLEKLYDKSATKFIANLYKKDKLSKKEISDLREYLDSLGKDGK